MKKNFIRTAFVAVFALMTGYSVYASQQEKQCLTLHWLMWKHWPVMSGKVIMSVIWILHFGNV